MLVVIFTNSGQLRANKKNQETKKHQLEITKAAFKLINYFGVFSVDSAGLVSVAGVEGVGAAVCFFPNKDGK